MFRHLSIKFKITLLNVLAVMGTGMVIGTLAVNKAMDMLAMNQQAHLESIRAMKKSQIEQYGQFLETSIHFFSEDEISHQFVRELIQLHKAMNVADTDAFPVHDPQVQAVHAKYDAHFKEYTHDYGYYDLLILCKNHGHVLYSVAKESDFGANLSVGKLKDSGLAKLWRKVVNTRQIVAVDMEPYAPSNDEPSMFIGSPIWDQNEIIGIAVLQVDNQAIAKIMRERAGLGQTGEVYLVGADNLMRSDSYLNEHSHSLQASFANPQQGRVGTTAVTEALNGNHGSQFTVNYKNQSVLAAFDTVNIVGVSWAIVAEVSQTEIFQDAYTLRNQILLIGSLIVVSIVVINFFTLKQLLITPLQHFQAGLLSFFAYLNRKTATARRLEIRNQDELGQMSLLVNQNIEQIEQGIAQDNQFLNNVAAIVQQTKVGELHDRVTATASNPQLNELKVLLNEVLEVVAIVLSEVGDNLDKLAQGQLTARVTQPYQGEYARLQQACNGIAQQIQNLFQENDTVLARMAAGNLAARISGDFIGEFSGVKISTNTMADKLQQLIQETSQVLSQFAQGEMAARIRSEFLGSFADIKQAVNAMADNIQTLILETNQIFTQLASGNMAARITGKFPGDFTELKRASNAMANDLQTIITETNQALAQLASGNMQLHISREFLGDFSAIKDALEMTAEKLAEATTKNTRQSWLKTGQSQLSAQTSGDKDLIRLAEDIINFITPYLEAQVGAFYLLQEPKEGEHYLKMIASHAYVWRKNAAYEFQIGEGIVGQAALERKQFVITQAPDDYIPIQSGLGAAPPRAVLVAPFLYENQLKGIIELATLTAFSDIQLEFLSQVLPMIAIAINTAQSRTQMQELLQQTQIQAQELQSQQEALQQTNEELQSQTEELQSQQEELQTQQEELRQSNEQLELRSQELERQQTAVQEKNAQLEQAKTAIQAKAEELELASKYKSEFLANMSHELRTPLNSLLILAQLLANNKENNLTESQIKYAQTIHSAGNDLLTLINDILDLSKVEAGKLEVNPEELALSELAASVEQKFQPIAETKGLTFALQLTNNLPSSIYTDQQRLQQILTNLLGNAFKFTTAGEVNLAIERPPVDIDLSRSQLNPEQTIAFKVIDSGIGVPKDKQKLIFEAFQQADGTTNRRFGGTGLGLSISRQLTQLLGGEIQLQSEEGKGSTFIVYLPERLNLHNPVATSDYFSTRSQSPTPLTLTNNPSPVRSSSVSNPLAHSSSVPAPPPVPDDDRDQLQASDKSLLIVEDDLNFSSLLMETARDKAFKCLLATDGQSGLQLAEQYQPSAIILDIGLPHLDGWSVMERLKNNPNTRHIPVHFVSGTDYHKEAKQLGAIGYGLKPISIEELTETFKNIDNFLTKSIKSLLLVTDNPQHQAALVEVVQNEDIQVVLATTRSDAYYHLQAKLFDCIVLDISVEQDSGIQLLKQLYPEPQLRQIPVIVYADRELTSSEESVLTSCIDELVIKAVHSPERLLDEVTLFLHQIESQLPQKQQQLLRKARDQEAILINKKVLLVDDDMRNIFALAATLEEKGMEILVAHNGREALQRLREQPDIAVILMDIMMPEMDGYEATRQIRAQTPFRKLPIIALTAKAMKGDKAKCIQAGANDYLAKPVDANKLLSLLRVWLYR